MFQAVAQSQTPVLGCHDELLGYHLDKIDGTNNTCFVRSGVMTPTLADGTCADAANERCAVAVWAARKDLIAKLLLPQIHELQDDTVMWAPEHRGERRHCELAALVAAGRAVPG